MKFILVNMISNHNNENLKADWKHKYVAMIKCDNE